MDQEKMTRLLRAVLFAAVGAALFYLAFRYLLRWLLPFLLALPTAAALEPFVLWCRSRLRFQRGFTAAVGTLLVVGLAGWLLFFLCSHLLEQAIALLSRLPEMLQGLPALVGQWEARWETLCAGCPEGIRDWLQSLAGRLGSLSLNSLADWSQRLLSALTSLVGALPQTALFCVTTVLAIFYTSARYPEIRAFLRRQIPARHRAGASGVKQSVTATMVKWLRAQCILLLLTFSVLLLGLLLLRVPYALLLAVLIAFVDLLPILGTGTVLIPWALLSLLAQDVPFAMGLLALQAVLLLQRSLLEPKLLAAQAGLPPLAALLAMYLGFSAMGIPGMILFPILLLLAKQLRDEEYVRLWK